jgi:CelD/BcsL family acetyltransferase involved in cellulose biosynthesis
LAAAGDASLAFVAYQSSRVLISPVNCVQRATPSIAYRTAGVMTVGNRAATADLSSERARNVLPEIKFKIYQSLEAVESEWRRFEQFADCTAFQVFEWLTAWHRHVGSIAGIVPVIAVGHFTSGETALIIPLAVESGRAIRRLHWFGQDLCDYNAPLLSPDFSQRVAPGRFAAVWRDLCKQIRNDPQTRYDWIELEKMPQTIGAQINPFTQLAVTLNPSGAHLTRLGDDWEKFYFDKRSSATRRHDRAKRRHMSQFGDVRFASCADNGDARRTMEQLIAQKRQAFQHRGIPDIFSRPGVKELFLEIASNDALRHLFHISRIDISDTCVAANFAILFGDCYYHVLASYDDTAPAAQFGPGALHLRELLAHAIKLGFKRFDFTIGDEPYKREWADAGLNLYDYSAPVTWRGWAASNSSFGHRRIKRFIKQTPILWKPASRVRSTIVRLLAAFRPSSERQP